MMMFAYDVVGGGLVNQEMLYSMFASTLSKMSDEELATSLAKAKDLLGESDFEKLVLLVAEERKKR